MEVKFYRRLSLIELNDWLGIRNLPETEYEGTRVGTSNGGLYGFACTGGSQVRPVFMLPSTGCKNALIIYSEKKSLNSVPALCMVSDLRDTSSFGRVLRKAYGV